MPNTCYPARDREEGRWSETYTVHERYPDGHCTCGHYLPRPVCAECRADRYHELECSRTGLVTRDDE